MAEPGPGKQFLIEFRMDFQFEILRPTVRISSGVLKKWPDSPGRIINIEPVPCLVYNVFLMRNHHTLLSH